MNNKIKPDLFTRGALAVGSGINKLLSMNWSWWAAKEERKKVVALVEALNAAPAFKYQPLAPAVAVLDTGEKLVGVVTEKGKALSMGGLPETISRYHIGYETVDGEDVPVVIGLTKTALFYGDFLCRERLKYGWDARIESFTKV